MGSPITGDAATSLDTLLVHHRDRRKKLAMIERTDTVEGHDTAGRTDTVERSTTVEHDPDAGQDTAFNPADDLSTLSRIIEVRNGHRAMGRARGRLLQTSLIFQALLALAMVLSIVAIVQYRATAAAGSPDAEPPAVLVQVSE